MKRARRPKANKNVYTVKNAIKLKSRWIIDLGWPVWDL